MCNSSNSCSCCCSCCCCRCCCCSCGCGFCFSGHIHGSFFCILSDIHLHQYEATTHACHTHSRLGHVKTLHKVSKTCICKFGGWCAWDVALTSCSIPAEQELTGGFLISRESRCMVLRFYVSSCGKTAKLELRPLAGSLHSNYRSISVRVIPRPEVVSPEPSWNTSVPALAPRDLSSSLLFSAGMHDLLQLSDWRTC